MAEVLATQPVPPPESSPAELSRGTLGRQLVVRVTALVALVAIAAQRGDRAGHRAGARSARSTSQLDDVTSRVRDPNGPNLIQATAPDASLLRPGNRSTRFAVVFSTDSEPAERSADLRRGPVDRASR